MYISANRDDVFIIKHVIPSIDIANIFHVMVLGMRVMKSNVTCYINFSKVNEGFASGKEKKKQ